jgi:hypothetical protein
VDAVADGADDTGHLQAGDVGRPSERRGVETLKLQEVGGVDAGGAHRDDDVVGTEFGGGSLGELEGPVVDHYGQH